MASKDIIKQGRLRLNLTEQQFADRVGVSRGAVQQWERGYTAPKRNNLPSVASVLGVSVAEIIDSSAKAKQSTWPFTLISFEEFLQIPKPDRDQIEELMVGKLIRLKKAA